MRRLPILLALAGPLCGAVTNVKVDATHRQALISYTAPNTNACSVTVFRDAARSIPATDTDTALFGAAASLDTRPGSISAGRRRTFVAGQIPLPGWAGYSPTETAAASVGVATLARAANVATAVTASSHGLTINDRVVVSGASDGSFNTDALVKSVVSATSFTYSSAGPDSAAQPLGGAVRRANRFSRALQADTQHWFRIACGADTYDGAFRTANIPFGSTYGEIAAYDWASAPMNLLHPTIPDTRGREVIDPLTGFLAKVGTRVYDSDDPPRSFSSGAQRSCSDALVNGGRHCTVETNGGSNRLYWFGLDGASRFLGRLRLPASSETPAFYPGSQAFWDPADANVFYGITTSTPLNEPVLVKAIYTGGDVEVGYNAYSQWVTTTLMPASGGKSLLELIRDFEPGFSKSTYKICIPISLQSSHLAGYCRAAGQNSPAWLWALYLGDKQPLGNCADCMRIVAAANIHSRPKSRWCGNHFSNAIPDANVIPFTTQRLGGGTATGPWEVRLLDAAGVDANATTFTVSGEPVCNAGSLPYDGSTYLQDAAVGDVFQFAADGTQERVRIVQKLTATSWVVERGYASSTKRSHAANAVMQAVCEPTDITGRLDFFWRYLDDPRALDGSNTHLIQDDTMSNIHRVERNPWNIGAGWAARHGDFSSANFKGPAKSIAASPLFSGVFAGLDGNSYQKHPSFENWNAPEQARRNWFVDLTPFQTAPVSNETVTKVGANYVYRINGNPAYPRNVRKSPYLFIAGLNVLLDISGPGAMLRDTSDDHYKGCAAYKAGECWPGSQANEFYANLPSLTYLLCGGAETYTGQNDLCGIHVAAYSQGVVQFGLGGQAGPGPASRVLVRGLAGPWRKWGVLTNARTTPDGQWLVFPTPLNDPSQAGMISMLGYVPESPAEDSVNRTEFVPLPVQLPGRAGAVRTVVEFGYHPDSSFRCTQRAEACIAASSAFNPATPYYFAGTDTYTGVDCTSGCSIAIPAISGRVVYYRWKYRDASGTALGTGPLQAAAVE